MAKKKKLRMRKANLILFVLLGLAILFVIVEDYYYEETPVTYSDLLEEPPLEEEWNWDDCWVKIEKELHKNINQQIAKRDEMWNIHSEHFGWRGEDGTLMTIPTYDGDRIFNLTYEEFQSLNSFQFLYVNSPNSSRKEELQELISLRRSVYYHNEIIYSEIDQLKDELADMSIHQLQDELC